MFEIIEMKSQNSNHTFLFLLFSSKIFIRNCIVNIDHHSFEKKTEIR